MARKATGQVIGRKRKGRRVFALRFRAYGQHRYVTLPDGTTREQAEVELENTRGGRAARHLAAARARAGGRGPRGADAPRVRVGVVRGKETRAATNTVAAYEWEISYHLLPFFARHRLSQITIAEVVDRYKNAKVRERDRGVKLSSETINKTLTRLAQILDHAVEYELIDRTPAAGKRRRLRVSTPPRSYLDSADQIEALLAAAAELDAKGRVRNRRAMLATFIFSGLRLGELRSLRWRAVDLANGRLRVGEAKTDAGVREVELLPALRDELAALKARSRSDSAALVFGTGSGKPESASNVRRRVLARAVEKANERLERDGGVPLPDGLTPHSLRRTFASLLYAFGHAARRDGSARARGPAPTTVRPH